jgi:hypothetical protein
MCLSVLFLELFINWKEGSNWRETNLKNNKKFIIHFNCFHLFLLFLSFFMYMHFKNERGRNTFAICYVKLKHFRSISLNFLFLPFLQPHLCNCPYTRIDSCCLFDSLKCGHSISADEEEKISGCFGQLRVDLWLNKRTFWRPMILVWSCLLIMSIHNRIIVCVQQSRCSRSVCYGT